MHIVFFLSYYYLIIFNIILSLGYLSIISNELSNNIESN